MRIAIAWVDSVLFMLNILCGLDYSVEGKENLENENGIIMMKHSSAWETLAQFKIFPEITCVLKRELMWAPFLGWALTVFKPIAIKRGGGLKTIEQLIEQHDYIFTKKFNFFISPILLILSLSEQKIKSSFTFRLLR